MSVLLASYPRSGNTFFRIVMNCLYDVKSAEGYDFVAGAESRAEGNQPEFLRVIGQTSASEIARTGDLGFVKTHELPEGEDQRPAVYLLRDGRDVCVSYAHFALAYHPDQLPSREFADVLRLLIGSKDHFGGWSRHVEAWTSRSAPTAVVRFEELSADPAGVAASACRTLDLPVPEAAGTLPGFEELKILQPDFFRKGRIGSWKEEMPPDLEELFWSLHGDVMIRHGYLREVAVPA
jgi:hypothetical protein